MSRNIGEDNSEYLDDSENRLITRVSPNDDCADDKCCWGDGVGYTASDDEGGRCSFDTSYPGCTRTVCNWDAANTPCNNYNAKGATDRGEWRLPTRGEINAWIGHCKNLPTFEPSMLFGEYIGYFDYNSSYGYNSTGDDAYIIAGITGFALGYIDSVINDAVSILWYMGDTTMFFPNSSKSAIGSACCVFSDVFKPYTLYLGRRSFRRLYSHRP